MGDEVSGTRASRLSRLQTAVDEWPCFHRCGKLRSRDDATSSYGGRNRLNEVPSLRDPDLCQKSCEHAHSLSVMEWVLSSPFSGKAFSLRSRHLLTNVFPQNTSVRSLLSFISLLPHMHSLPDAWKTIFSLFLNLTTPSTARPGIGSQVSNRASHSVSHGFMLGPGSRYRTEVYAHRVAGTLEDSFRQATC